MNSQVIARLDSFTVNESSTTTFKVQSNDDTCTNVSGSIVRMNLPPLNGLATRSADFKNFSYVPNANFYGMDSFKYTLVGCISTDSSIAWVHIKVLAVNQPPKAFNDTVYINEDKTAVIDVQNNDSDRESPVLATLLDILPKHGTAYVLPGFDSIKYIPNANFNGRDSFKYSISDDATGSSGLTASAWVHIFIKPVYDTFLLNTSFTQVSVLEDSTICIDIAPFVKEIDTVNLWSISILNASKNGRDSIKSRTMICYKPNPDFNGNDSIVINICDTNNVCKPFKIKITVTPVDDIIIAIVDTVYLQVNQKITFKPTVNDINIDNHLLVLSLVTNTVHGTTSIILDSINYIPSLNYIGVDSQIYKISVTGKSIESSAKIYYIILDSTTSPIATADFYYVNIRKTKNLNVLINDTIKNPPYSIKFISTPTRVKASLHNNGFWITVTGDSTISLDTFYYEVCNKFKLCDTALVIIKTIDSTGTYFNSNDTAYLISGIDYRGSVKGYKNNMTRSLNYSILNNGTKPVTIDSLGIWTYNYPLGYEGFDSFFIEICDYSNPVLCDTILQYVKVTKSEDSLFSISNSLSPNSDGLNDYLYINNVNLAKNNNLKVFNRWGDIVLDKNDYNNDWYGTNEKTGVNFGTVLADGIYFYVFQYNNKGNLSTKSGYINLKR